MPNKTLINLSNAWVCEHLCDVTEKDMTWVLVQEAGFIGFGVVQLKDIWWPPYKQSGWEPDWDLVSDLRLFGKKGEWHVWRDWDGKHYARLLEFDVENEKHVWISCDRKDQDNPEKSKKREALTEYHALWGTKVGCGKSSWIKVVEDRGAEIWIPPLEGTELEDGNLPLRLKLKQVVDYDPEYHLAGIVDAALVGLVRSSDEKLLLPTDLPSCS